MATTFNIFMSNQAVRFRGDLQKNIFAPYLLAERKDMRIITIFLGPIQTARLGRHGQTEQEFKYIRIVIDIPVGRLKGAEERQELLNRTAQSCMEYGEKYRDEYEVEIRINEFDVGDVLRIVPKGM
jgi:hypothetical protein